MDEKKQKKGETKFAFAQNSRARNDLQGNQ